MREVLILYLHVPVWASTSPPKSADTVGRSHGRKLKAEGTTLAKEIAKSIQMVQDMQNA